MSEVFDAIVIGSGAGGAPVAHQLARAGKRVLVLEKGPLLDVQDKNKKQLSDYKRDELFAYGTEKTLHLPEVKNHGKKYFASHIEPDLSDEPHVYKNRHGEDLATMEGYTAQAVGGGTQLYGGVSLRFTEDDFRLQSFNQNRQIDADPNNDIKRESRDWPISYQELEPYYCLTEKLIGINGTSDHQLKAFSEDNYHPPLTPNPISEHAHRGMTLLAQSYRPGVRPYRPPLAVITRDHDSSGRKVKDPDSLKTSFVNRYGDPLGYKSSTWVSLLKPAMQDTDLQLWPNCVVTHLEASNDKVSKVHLRTPDGSKRVVQGKLVIVACSAIESIRLLMLSSEEDAQFATRMQQNDLLGKYFLTHCFGGASGLLPRRYDKSQALDADWAIDVCATQEFMDAHKLWAGGAIYNNTSDQALPISLFRTHNSHDLDSLWQGFREDSRYDGRHMMNLLNEQFGRELSISFMANQVPQKSNHVRLHPTVRDKWNRPAAYVIKNWHSHDEHLMTVMAEQCKKVLQLGALPGEQIDDLQAGGIFSADNATARMANHILGGARFGNDPADSVLDKYCRAWGFDNLYVTDGAFMPTSGSANPTLTIQANAFRVADHLLQRL